jgi:hypothetical protein
MKKGRIELSLTQVIAGVLATITAAVLASFLGVAGTLIGAAIASCATTVGGAVYNYSLRRTSERLRTAAGAAATAARRAGARDPGRRAGARAATGRPADRGTTTRPDEALTKVFLPLQYLQHDEEFTGAALRPDQGRPDQGRPDQGRPPGAGPQREGTPGEEHRDGTQAAARTTTPDKGDEAPGGWHISRWLVLVGAAIGIFAIAIGAITVVEAIAGKPVATIVRQQPGSGTTIGGVVGGTNPRRSSPRPTSPATSPATSRAQPSGTPSSSGQQASPTPTGAASGSPGPSTVTSPAQPTPSGSPTAQPTAPKTR